MIKTEEFGPGYLDEVLGKAKDFVEHFYPPKYTVLDVVVSYIKYGIGQYIWTVTIYYKEVT